MRIQRALIFGILGASAISGISAALRAIGMPIQLEIIMGTAFGGHNLVAAFLLGLALHLAIGGAFGLLYGWLFERVWAHGGASTGMILGVIHAALIGMLVGLTPRFHPLIPEQIMDPGPYFANAGSIGVIAFFAVHILYGAIVGHGYGHVDAEREWAPGRHHA